jgi:quercetin dioxygenase-like cupin family protein
MLTLKRTAALGTLVALLGLVTVALASPPSGQHTTPPIVGTLQPTDRIKTDEIKFRASRQAEISTFTLTLDPGGFTGWHTHPGILFATVHSGAVVREVGCEAHLYAAGEAFVEHGDQPTGQVRNASATAPAAFSVTHIAPPGVPKRAESEPPTCRHRDSRRAG